MLSESDDGRSPRYRRATVRSALDLILNARRSRVSHARACTQQHARCECVRDRVRDRERRSQAASCERIASAERASRRSGYSFEYTLTLSRCRTLSALSRTLTLCVVRIPQPRSIKRSTSREFYHEFYTGSTWILACSSCKLATHFVTTHKSLRSL